MTLDFNLDFFYYQREAILDGQDPIYLANLKQKFKFIEYGKQASVEELVELMVFVYAKKYAINQWFSVFKNPEQDFSSKFPEDLDPELDLYLSEEEIISTKIKSFSTKQFDDPEHNTTFDEWIRLEFINPQQLSNLAYAIMCGWIVERN